MNNKVYIIANRNKLAVIRRNIGINIIIEGCTDIIKLMGTKCNIIHGQSALCLCLNNCISIFLE